MYIYEILKMHLNNSQEGDKMNITDGSVEYKWKNISSIEDLNISDFAHTFLDDTSANEVRNTLDLASKNELGFRKPNTAYTVGQIVYHNILPIGWYLECTSAGTSNSGELTINSPSIGGTVNDGTVTWIIRMPLSTNGGVLTGDRLKRDVNDSSLILFGGEGYNYGAELILYGKDDVPSGGRCILLANNGTEESRIIMTPQGDIVLNKQPSNMTTELGGASIVAKSLGGNCYIKYASGLIIQWGIINISANINSINVNFPISFSNNQYCAMAINIYNGPAYYTIEKPSQSSTTIHQSTTFSGITIINWFAIGY